MALPEIPGITVLRPDDPLFFTQLRTLVDPLVLNQIEPLIPFTYVLQNNRQRTVIAYSTEWRGTDPSGIESVPITDLRWSLPLFRGPNAIEPGESRFVSPIRQFGIADAGRLGNSLAQAFNRYLPRLHSSAHVQPVLDAVVFADGQVYGLDRSNTNYQIKAYFDAERQIASMSDEELAEALAANARKDKRYIGPLDYPPTYDQALAHRKRNIFMLLLEVSAQNLPTKRQAFLESLKRRALQNSGFQVSKAETQ